MLKLSRPLHIFLVLLTYLLGYTIAAYLGRPLQIGIFFLGLTFVLLAQWSMALLSESFRPHNEPLVENETPAQKERLRNNLLYFSIAGLTANLVIAFIIYLNGTLTLPSFIFLLSSFILVLAYSIPPIRLRNRGFGELILALHIAYIVPSIGFLLQAEENSRLLTLLTLPLTTLALAYFLILNFVDFPIDEKYERKTLLRQLTWQRAIPLHHSLLAFAYIMFAMMPVMGFSLNLIWPAFLALPFAIFQIIQVRAIGLGNAPNWRLLTSTALAVFGLTVYFLIITFWL